MPTTPHAERHFQGSETLRDVVIGMSDGLTVPFALAAGLSGAVAQAHLVVTAGLAEIAAGSIAMGLGGYLAARSDAEHYATERAREQVELREKPRVEFLEVKGILESYGLESEDAERITSALQSRPDAMIDFMMRFELGLEQPRQGRAWKSALTIAAAYIAGGLVPLLPYMFESSARHALTLSTVVTLSALGIFGYVKGRFTGSRPVRSLLQTMAIGSLAAGAAFLIARAVNG